MIAGLESGEAIEVNHQWWQQKRTHLNILAASREIITKRIIITPKASLDIDEYFVYIAEENPQL
ncbi:hypothetical protein [Nostoc sp. JL33]|uniref:hypothetical protein n=1 Tax=Nostoc sp. JL33 TaxID=2815396 RepID=UPI00341BFD49